MKTEVSTLRTKFLATGRPVFLAAAMLLLALPAPPAPLLRAEFNR